MSHARRYHEPGVGARTGMRIEEGMIDLDDFLEAGRRAMNGGSNRKSTVSASVDEGSESEVESQGERTAVIDAVPGSSSMMIVHSPGPSPRSTIRRSQAPSSSPFLSSPGTARNQSVSPHHFLHAVSPTTGRSARISSETDDVRTFSSPSKARAQQKKMMSAGLEARREKKRMEEEERERANQQHSTKVPSSTQATESDDERGDGEGTIQQSMTEQENLPNNIDLSLGGNDYETSIAIQQFPTPLSEGLEPSLISLHPAKESIPTKKAKPTATMKETKGKGSVRVLKEKNGTAIQSLAKPSTKGKARKRTEEEDGEEVAIPQYKAPRVEERTNRGGSAQREVVEKIPSSHHRQASVDTGDGHDDGVRRGSRYRYKPLEYWRGEKARFGRPSLPKSTRIDEEGVGDETIDGDAFEDHFAGSIPPVAVLKEIIRIPREEGEGTFSGMKIKKEKTNERVKSTTAREPKKDDTGPPKSRQSSTEPTRHAEEGWDKDTEMKATVWDADTKADVEMQIACTSSQVRPRLAVNSTFGFEKVFVVDHAMATGVLFVLVDGQKPLKNSKDNNYTFVVLEGAVRIQIHKTEFIVAPHGMFFVPRGNDYSIQNTSKRTAKVAFTQCRGS